MKLELKALKVANFKGFTKEQYFEFDEVTLIGGKNATGKTSIVDAVTYLLFGKDSLDRVNFGIKPIYTKGAKKGQPINKLDSVVEASFELDGELLTLKKTYSEEWTKKRGSAVESFTGHKTACEWNGVPIGITEYNQRIAQLVDAEVFKTLSNPSYFSSRKTAEKRALLFELIDEVDIDDIVATNAELGELKPLLERHTEEELLKMKKSSQTKINQELKQIPARIDELESLVDEEDLEALEAEKQALEGEFKSVTAEIAGLRNDEKQEELKAKRTALLQEAAKLREREETVYRELLSKLYEASLKASNELMNGKKKLDTANYDYSRIQSAIAENERTVEELRVAWEEADAEEYNGETTCPTCGKPLDEDVVSSAVDKFNQAKATKLAKAREDATKILGETEKMKSKSAELQKLQERLESEIAELRAQNAEAEKTYSAAFVEGHPKTKEQESIEAQLEALGDELNAQTVPEELPKLNARATQLQEALLDVERRITRQGMNEGYLRRIKELEESMQEHSASYEENERIIFLLEEFAKAKVALVSDALNAKFKLVNWKLYDIQINGGLSETCVATVNGIPYDEGLNNANRINAGLDIINAFSKHYDVEVPVFIDNAESVNELIDTQGQKIALYVTDDAKLTKL